VEDEDILMEASGDRGKRDSDPSDKTKWQKPKANG
jgi:hypothetical protein